ncbi:hypothetical protein JCM10213v2_005805 [Rhodosporidiobolus nylandii]
MDRRASSFAAAERLDDAAFPPFLPYSSTPEVPLSFTDAQSVPYFDPSRMSPRSRAYSTASSVSSVASSVQSSFFGESPNTSAGARPSLDLPAAGLQPGCDGEGFVVDVPGVGPWSVGWGQLVELLANPRLQQDPTLYPQPTYRPSTGISLVGADLNSLGLAEPAPPARADEDPFLYSLRSAPELPLDETHYAPIPPATSRRRAPEPIRTSGTFVTPLQQAFVPQVSALPAYPQPPLQHERTYSRDLHLPQAFQQQATTASSHYPPPISTECLSGVSSFDAFNSPYSASTTPHTAVPVPQHSPHTSQDSLNLRPASLASTRHLRNTSSPYARRPAHLRHSSQASVSTTSSLANDGLSSRSGSVDLSFDADEEYVPSGTAGTASGGGEGGGRGGKKVKRPLRPLNPGMEMYLWAPTKGQLSRVPLGVEPEEVLRTAEDGAEILTFPPGSYYKVIQDDLEVLPCDAKTRANDWLRGQACVEKCSFRFDGKRPSVIRQHVVGCRTRQLQLGHKPGGDPLKRLCQLQLDAQNMDAKLKKKQHQRASLPSTHFANQGGQLPPDPPPSASLPEDEAYDRRSVISAESQMSGRSTGSLDSNGISDHAVQAFISPASATPSAGFDTSMTSVAEDGWLASYGLSVPTGADSLPYPPTASTASFPDAVSSSFLSMDE